jgi:hypothetical protein
MRRRRRGRLPGCHSCSQSRPRRPGRRCQRPARPRNRLPGPNRDVVEPAIQRKLGARGSRAPALGEYRPEPRPTKATTRRGSAYLGMVTALTCSVDGNGVIAVEDGAGAPEGAVEPVDRVEHDLGSVEARAERIRVSRVVRGERLAGEREAGWSAACALPCRRALAARPPSRSSGWPRPCARRALQKYASALRPACQLS